MARTVTVRDSSGGRELSLSGIIKVRYGFVDKPLWLTQKEGLSRILEDTPYLLQWCNATQPSWLTSEMDKIHANPPYCLR